LLLAAIATDEVGGAQGATGIAPSPGRARPHAGSGGAVRGATGAPLGGLPAPVARADVAAAHVGDGLGGRLVHRKLLSALLEEVVQGVEGPFAGDAAGEYDPDGGVVDDDGHVVVLRTPEQLDVEAVVRATGGDMASPMCGEVCGRARHFSPP